MREYNSNIALIRQVTKAAEQLEPNQYYALMVVDKKHRERDTRQFFDVTRGWIGLERTSKNLIYISKSFTKRSDLDRGSTWIVSVQDVSNCYVLS